VFSLPAASTSFIEAGPALSVLKKFGNSTVTLTFERLVRQPNENTISRFDQSISCHERPPAPAADGSAWPDAGR